MPGGSRSIVVGGGIQSAAPFTVGTLPVVSVAVPPTVVDSQYRQQGNSVTDVTQTLIGTGQTNSVSSALDAILIGRGSTLANGWPNMVSIGPSNTLGEDAGVAIGSAINISAANASGFSIAIGRSIDISSQGAGPASLNVVIGSNFSRLATEAVRDCLLIGHTVSVGGNGTGTNRIIAIGNGQNFSGAGSSADVVNIGHGGSWRGNQSVGIGSGVNASNQSVVIGQAANGGNSGANNVVVGRAAGGVNNRSRGVAVGATASFNGGDNNVAVGYAAAATGAGGIAIGSQATAAGGEFAVGSTAVPLNLITIGNTGAVGIHLTTAATLAFNNAANTFNNLTITDAGNVSVVRGTFGYTLDRGLVVTGQVSSAGAAAGTLNNAPAAGDPTFWLRVTVNGTNFALPLWPG
jgi:hypothetical protein